jgi:hypothetical protein
VGFTNAVAAAVFISCMMAANVFEFLEICGRWVEKLSEYFHGFVDLGSQPRFNRSTSQQPSRDELEALFCDQDLIAELDTLPL